MLLLIDSALWVSHIHQNRWHLLGHLHVRTLHSWRFTRNRALFFRRGPLYEGDLLALIISRQLLAFNGPISPMPPSTQFLVLVLAFASFTLLTLSCARARLNATDCCLDTATESLVFSQWLPCWISWAIVGIPPPQRWLWLRLSELDPVGGWTALICYLDVSLFQLVLDALPDQPIFLYNRRFWDSTRNIKDIERHVMYLIIKYRWTYSGWWPDLSILF